jgi:hypothetical protein
LNTSSCTLSPVIYDLGLLSPQCSTQFISGHRISYLTICAAIAVDYLQVATPFQPFFNKSQVASLILSQITGETNDFLESISERKYHPSFVFQKNQQRLDDFVNSTLTRNLFDLKKVSEKLFSKL